MYCDDYSLKYFKIKKKKRIQKRVLCLLFFVFLILFLVFLFFFKVVNPVIYSYGESEVEKLLITSSNNAVLNISTVSYDSIVTISYNDQKEISSIVVNGGAVNNLGNALVMETQKELDILYSLGVSIPIGNLTGIPLLSGKGSLIHFDVNPIGNVVCEFYSSFIGAGINQTSHKIIAKIVTSANLILPLQIKKITKSVEYVIAECIIVGKVPNTYLGLSPLK